jgi:hypothetical protein
MNPVATAYIEYRGLPASVCDEWLIGYANHPSPMMRNRVTIPIFGCSQQTLVSVSGRSIDEHEQPKYWHPPFVKSRWLYGLWKPLISTPVLCEGFFDVWALRLIGYSAYATMGSALSAWQAAHVAGRSATCIVYPHEDEQPYEWVRALAAFGVKVAFPLCPYPHDAPPKADPHWLYVNNRAHLQGQLADCLARVRRTPDDALRECLQAR